jgi:hypothetical protein
MSADGHFDGTAYSLRWTSENRPLLDTERVFRTVGSGVTESAGIRRLQRVILCGATIESHMGRNHDRQPFREDALGTIRRPTVKAMCPQTDSYHRAVAGEIAYRAGITTVNVGGMHTTSRTGGGGSHLPFQLKTFRVIFVLPRKGNQHVHQKCGRPF